MKVAFPLAVALLIAAVCFADGGGQPPAVRIPSATYATRDVDALFKALDDFDAKVLEARIDMKEPGWEVELRLVRVSK